MKTLIFGAGGYIGSAAALALKGAGHEVSGFARNADVQARLRSDGFGALLGDLSDLPSLARGVLDFDAIVFTPRLSFAEEGQTLEALVSALEGTGKTFIFVTGTGVMNVSTPLGEWRSETFGETDPFTPEPWIAHRVQVERRFLSWADRGVRAMLLRPSHVWGRGGSTIFSALFDGIRRSGAAAYIGQGLNDFAHVNVDDLADLCRLVLERGEPGGIYNAVSGEMNPRAAARAAAEVMQCRTTSLTLEEAQALWGQWMAPALFGMSCTARGPQALALGWKPTRLDPEVDIRDGGYQNGPSMLDFERATRARLGVDAAG